MSEVNPAIAELVRLLAEQAVADFLAEAVQRADEHPAVAEERRP